MSKKKAPSNKDKLMDIKLRALCELVQLSLEIHKLKPFVGETQMEAAERIKKHTGNLAVIMKELV